MIELFLTTDAARARDLAQQLHDQNAGAPAGGSRNPRYLRADGRAPIAAAALVYYAENWHRGVLGIVASRLVERCHRPVFVLGRNPEDGLAQGSGRSIPAFHLLDALESMADLFVRFGGHSHAAGVTLDAARVEEFRERFNAYAPARLPPEDLRPRLESTPCWNCLKSRKRRSTISSPWRPSATATRPALRRAGCGDRGAAGSSEGKAPAPDRAPEGPLAGAEGLELRRARRGTGARRARRYRLLHGRGRLFRGARIPGLVRDAARCAAGGGLNAGATCIYVCLASRYNEFAG